MIGPFPEADSIRRFAYCDAVGALVADKHAAATQSIQKEVAGFLNAMSDGGIQDWLDGQVFRPAQSPEALPPRDVPSMIREAATRLWDEVRAGQVRCYVVLVSHGGGGKMRALREPEDLSGVDAWEGGPTNALTDLDILEGQVKGLWPDPNQRYRVSFIADDIRQLALDWETKTVVAATVAPTDDWYKGRIRGAHKKDAAWVRIRGRLKDPPSTFFKDQQALRAELSANATGVSGRSIQTWAKEWWDNHFEPVLLQLQKNAQKLTGD